MAINLCMIEHLWSHNAGFGDCFVVVLFQFKCLRKNLWEDSSETGFERALEVSLKQNRKTDCASTTDRPNRKCSEQFSAATKDCNKEPEQVLPRGLTLFCTLPTGSNTCTAGSATLWCLRVMQPTCSQLVRKTSLLHLLPAPNQSSFYECRHGKECSHVLPYKGFHLNPICLSASLCTGTWRVFLALPSHIRNSITSIFVGLRKPGMPHPILQPCLLCHSSSWGST